MTYSVPLNTISFASDGIGSIGVTTSLITVAAIVFIYTTSINKSSNVSVSVPTANCPEITSVVTLATITIPAGLMGANGKLKIYPLWSTTNNANQKTLRAIFSGSTCSTMVSQSVPNNSGLVIIRNINSESVQKCSSGLVAGIGSSTGSIASPTVDTTAATTITLTGQLAVGTDTMTLEDLFVEVV